MSTGCPFRPPEAFTDFCQAWTTFHADAIVEPNGPEHEHITPILTRDPAAELVAAPVAPAFADVELDPLVLLDEHALTDTAAAKAATTTTKILRVRTMSRFLPPLSAGSGGSRYERRCDDLQLSWWVEHSKQSLTLQQSGA
jgi:hypothetical protein